MAFVPFEGRAGVPSRRRPNGSGFQRACRSRRPALGHQVFDCLAEPPPRLHEMATLRRRHQDPFRQLAPQDLVLGLQAMDLPSQFLAGRGDQDIEEWVENPGHGDRMRLSVSPAGPGPISN
jgi:hypothetical protein